MASSSNASAESDSQYQDDAPPLWAYVNKVKRLGTTSSNWVWTCKICDGIRTGSYSRVKAHLLKLKGRGIEVCTKVTPKQVAFISRLDEEYERSKGVARSAGSSILVPLPSVTLLRFPGDTDSMEIEIGRSKRKKSGNPISQAHLIKEREDKDAEIARMFYSGGVPFNLARNPSYVSSYTIVCGDGLVSYVPPGYNELRTTLLDNERNNVENLLNPMRGTWPAKGVTIVSNGWSDPKRRPFINFMAVCESGPMFIKAVDCRGMLKDDEFIAKLTREVIDEVGHRNVVQVIMDNAVNRKGAGEIIEGIYPHIYWTPCVVHALNLALKDIWDKDGDEECHWITLIHDEVLQIKDFIMNHGMRLAIYSRFAPLKLLSVADTRFASMIVMLKRFKRVKPALESMVCCDQWTTYRENDMEKARFAREKIVSEEWWDKVDRILALSAPIYDMIRACDTDRPCLHLVYEMWDSMLENVKKVIYEQEHLVEGQDSSFYEVLYEILVSRWLQSKTPLHCVANSLNPIYYSQEWLSEDSARVPPHMDEEISTLRLQCFRRLFPSEDVYDKVLDEFANFSLEDGSFGQSDARKKKHSMDPRKWWASFGAGAPTLQRLALKLLGHPTSSSCCEKNWSTYGFIHSLKRNKLNPKRAEDLVYVHTNLRLLSRNTKEYYEGKSKMWDLGGDVHASLEDSGILALADLSLDEPELENAIINEER